MRHCFEHKRTYSCAHAKFEIVCGGLSMANMTTAANKRDIYMRALFRVASNPVVYVTKTLAEAVAITGELADAAARTAAGVVAYQENFTLDGAVRTFSLTNHAPVAPDLAGLVVQYDGIGDAGLWDAVWGYTAAPAEVLLDELLEVLGERMGTGQALDGYSTARMTKGPAGLEVMSQDQDIVAGVPSEDDEEAAAGTFALKIPFTLAVGSIGSDAGGPVNYSRLLRDAGQIRSIIFDEVRTLNGLCGETVVASITGPERAEGDEEPYTVARIEGHWRIFTMQSDKP